ncbi:MAG: polysaccharide pyruvyl transferase family protein, partial [Thermoanaerobaculia bacterium]
IIGLCDFFVGARMHACIAALSQSIPTVAIAYSDKYTGVLESIGVGQLVADPRHLGIDAIIGIVDNAFEHRDAIRAHLRQVMPLVRNEVLRSLDEHRDAVDLGETLHLHLRTDDLAAEWPAGFRSASLAPGRST